MGSPEPVEPAFCQSARGIRGTRGTRGSRGVRGTRGTRGKRGTRGTRITRGTRCTRGTRGTRCTRVQENKITHVQMYKIIRGKSGPGAQKSKIVFKPNSHCLSKRVIFQNI